MGTNCTPLPLADLFLYAYGVDFLHWLLNNKDKKIPQCVNYSFRYIDDVLSPSNSRLGDYIHLIYINELEIWDTINTQMSASFLELDNGGTGTGTDLSQD